MEILTFARSKNTRTKHVNEKFKLQYGYIGGYISLGYHIQTELQNTNTNKKIKKR